MPMTWACLEELGGTWGAHAERRGQSRGWALDLGSLSAVWASRRVPRKGPFSSSSRPDPLRSTKAIRSRGPSQHFLFHAGPRGPQEGWADLARRWSGRYRGGGSPEVQRGLFLSLPQKSTREE